MGGETSIHACFRAPGVTIRHTRDQGAIVVHLMSWHQVCRDDELAQNLVRIREAGLIPEEKIRLGIIGGGAPWIWKRCKETFPSAKEILDYYHCSEYVHDVANAHYGKETKEMTRKELKTKNLTTIFVLLNNLQKIGNAP